MKKRILSFLCVLILAFSIIHPFAVFADDIDIPSLASVTKNDGKFYFHILLDNEDVSYSKANLTLAIYNEKGKLLDVKMEEINQNESEKIISIDENIDIASYKIMLFDVEKQFKPLCKAKKGTVKYSEIKEPENIEIKVKDIKKINGNSLEYCIGGISDTKIISIADYVEYELNCGLDWYDGYDIADLLSLDEDIELQFVENTGDSSYDVINATQYDTMRIEDVDITDEYCRIKIERTWIDLDDESVEYVFEDDNGKTIEPSDFAIGDVVAVAADNKVFRRAYYLKIVRLTKNVITGTVTDVFVEGNIDYVKINGVKYEDLYGLEEDDTGRFYINRAGKIFDFENTVPPNYAYILEAVKEPIDFVGEFWKVKLLTIDGVREYELTEKASEEFEEYKYILANGSRDDYWLFEDNRNDLDNEHRLIDFTVDSEGKIKKFAYIKEREDISLGSVNQDEYNEYKKKIYKYTLDEDTVIFDVTASQADDTRVLSMEHLIDDNEYSGIIITFGDEVPVFVMTQGEVNENVEEEIKPDNSYAYILEAEKEPDSFGEGVWSVCVNLLTSEGVMVYSLSEMASEIFDDYKVNLGITNDAWYFADNCNERENPYRVITYTINSGNELASFENVIDDNTGIVDIEGRRYKSSRNELGDENLHEEAMIFDITGSRAQDAYVFDLSYFQIGCEYSGMGVKVGEKINLFVACDVEMVLNSDNGFAVVTGTDETTVNGESVFVVDYLLDMAEGSVTFDEESEVFEGTEIFDYSNLKTGDIIMFFKNPKTDRVACYAVLGRINERGTFDVCEDTLLAFDRYTGFVYGYIANEDGYMGSFDRIYVGGVTNDRDREIQLVVTNYSNTYSYYVSEGRKEIMDYYMAENADWYYEGSNPEKDEATFFFAKLDLDFGDVIDIYTINKRIVGIDNIMSEAANSVYVNCETGEVVRP